MAEGVGEVRRRDRVELADAIGLVREQLIRAQQQGRQIVAGQVLTFEVGSVSIELSGEIEKSSEAGGGASFWVLTADAQRSSTRTSGQTITVELTPRVTGQQDQGFIVSDGVDAPPSR